MSLPDTSIRVYQSTDTGAPTLSGTAGTLVSVLDCLVNGYNTVTLTSLGVASNVATGYVSGGHGFTMIGGIVGPVITISGATPAGLNGNWRLAGIADSTHFTFATSGIADQTASGSITAKLAGSTFSKVFSGTNKGVYKSTSLIAGTSYLRIDDTGAQSAVVGLYETMSDVDTGTGGIHDGTWYLYKSSAASGTARAWFLITDGIAFHLLVENGDGTYINSGLYYGDMISYKAGDAYAALLLAGGNTASLSNYSYHLNDTTYKAVLRSYSQAGGYVLINLLSHIKTPSYIGVGGQVSPDPVDTAIHFWPVEVWEGGNFARGLLPGVLNPIHDGSVSLIGLVVPSVNGHSVLIKQNYLGRIGFDITGPWR